MKYIVKKEGDEYKLIAETAKLEIVHCWGTKQYCIEMYEKNFERPDSSALKVID